MSTVEFRDFGWRPSGRQAPTVSGVDLRIERGERVLLLGASGSGKSTLLSAMAGLLDQDLGEQTGTVLIDGHEAAQSRDRVGICFQDPQSQLVMARAGDDVAFGLENRGVPYQEIWPRVDKALSMVNFGYEHDRFVHALSGGEQQRLVLAGALAYDPSLLLLDEPTANLDPAQADAIADALGAALGGTDTTMVLVEHRISKMLPLVDRVIALNPDGTMLADGPVRTVFADHGEQLARNGVWTPDALAAPVRRSRGTGTAVLSAHHVDQRYTGADENALNDVSLDINASQLTALVGVNGSGKSTLARLLGGLTAPKAGGVYARGDLAHPRGKPLHRWRAGPLSETVGSVFQNPEQQFVTATVKEELRHRGIRAAPVSPQRADELLERLRLQHLAEANPFTLSGGEARRLSVATVLAHSPDIVILDEPTFGQDRRTWLELVQLIADLRDDGLAVVAATHDEDFIEAVSDRTVRLSGGELC